MDIKAIEKAAVKIQNQLFKKASANALGAFKSQFKGSGLQFREHQIYTPGDDVRFIDWKISARLSKTYIKTFEEERNVEIVVCVDFSSACHMGYKKVSKLQAALEMACLIGFLAQRTKDHVKVIFLQEPEIQTPFLAGRELITYITVQLDRLGYVDVNKTLRRDFTFPTMSNEKKIKLMLSYAQRKKEVVLISDFYDFEVNDFKKLQGQRHMHLFKMITPFDYAKSIPFTLWGNRLKDKIFLPRVVLESEANDSHDKLKNKFHPIDLSKGHLEQLIKEMA